MTPCVLRRRRHAAAGAYRAVGVAFSPARAPCRARRRRSTFVLVKPYGFLSRTIGCQTAVDARGVADLLTCCPSVVPRGGCRTPRRAHGAGGASVSLPSGSAVARYPARPPLPVPAPMFVPMLVPRSPPRGRPFPPITPACAMANAVAYAPSRSRSPSSPPSALAAAGAHGLPATTPAGAPQLPPERRMPARRRLSRRRVVADDITVGSWEWGVVSGEPGRDARKRRIAPPTFRPSACASG